MYIRLGEEKVIDNFMIFTLINFIRIKLGIIWKPPKITLTEATYSNRYLEIYIKNYLIYDTSGLKYKVKLSMQDYQLNATKIIRGVFFLLLKGIYIEIFHIKKFRISYIGQVLYISR